MQFLCKADDLVSGLQIAAKAVSPRTTLPILSGILLEAEAGTLRLAASDLDVSVETNVPIETAEPGRCVVPAKYIVELVRKFPPAELRISTEPDSNSVKIEAGRSVYRMSTMDPEEFPAFPECKGKVEMQIGAGAFSDLARLSTFAAASDDARPFVSGVLLEAGAGNISMVATDTFRLSIARMSQGDIDGKIDGAIVPAKIVSEVARLSTSLSQDLRVTVGDSQIQFTLGSTKVVARLIEGKFPPYRLVIPEHYLARLNVGVKPLAEAVDRVAVLVRDDVGSVRFAACGGTLVITANTPDLGGAHEEVPALQEGEDAEVVIRAKYLLEALKAMDEEDAIVDITGAGGPVCIRDKVDEGRYTHLIMPVVTD